ncbi:carbohydrate ABC transporter permease [Caldanaerobius polysaccharolyticus]|uniref:carbohydrate ABC transporter permease n=1 Tax=Caldanaerobius polysaccharolyticus TaxID=44256 RepID=UPI00047BEED7|nr:carbohydrate ABC transporter permease [Caldanaerobius polysaccharolyticus]
MKSLIKRINILEIFGWILTLTVIFPVYIMLVNSFKDRREIFTNELSLPSKLDFTFYLQAIQKMDFFNAFKNSLIITICSVILIIILSSMAAWVLVRDKSAISNIIFYTFVATILIPFQSVMIPLVQYLNKWQLFGGNFSLINTRYGLIFMNIGFGLSMSIFLFHGFIKNVPVEMEEAATIDGCNKLQLFWRIVFPNLKPIIITVAILNIISLWNDYLLPSLVLQSPELRTIPLSTFFFFGEFTIEWNLALAGLVVTIIPVIIFYLFAQKYIIKGVIAGAIK